MHGIPFLCFQFRTDALGPILRRILITFSLLVFAVTGSITSVYAAQGERKVQSAAKKNGTS